MSIEPQVEDALRPEVSEASRIGEVVEEVEEVLGGLRFDLETGIHGRELRGETVAQLEQLRDAAEHLLKAGSALGRDALTALYFVNLQSPESWLEALRPLALLAARDARFAVENLRSEPTSKGGRPRADAERAAVRALMQLWEKHTGRGPSFHGAREDGGPCLVFVNACVRAVPGLGGFNGERLFRELLKAHKAQ